ncbi:MAG: hypothetical protein HY901_10725 [Deltaproteobacteria bacterium]|nr:hypothetical protein [Deltaproteobacteria bacterium]
MSRMFKTALAMVLATSCFGGTGPGVIVGFVVNGQTGERLNFFQDDGSVKNLSDDADATSQVYTLINGEFVRATPCDSGFINAENAVQADGCFKLHGIPYGAELPIFAVRNGFERFHGVFQYPNATIDADGNEHGLAQVVANIRMFPKTYAVDYKMLVHLDGRGINDVNVACQIRQQSVQLTTEGQFLTPLNTVSQAINTTTSNDGTYGDGFAQLAGAELVLGATYHCTAYKNDLYENRGVLTGTAEFVAGVDAPEVSLPLGSSQPDEELLYAVYSNADDPTSLLGSRGSLIITFNRPVEIVPGTADCQTASINAPDTNGDFNVVPMAQSDVLGNSSSEQVQVTSTGETGLKISFTSPTNTFDSKDVGATVEFHGVFVRPKGSSGTVDGNVIRMIGAASNACSAAGDIDAQELRSARTEVQTNVLHLF